METETTFGNVKATFTRVPTIEPEWKDARTWSVELSFYSRHIAVAYHTGSAIAPESLTALDVLECLFSDAESYENARDFEDFANDFGYDVDSRKAEATYKECGEIRDKLRDLLVDQYENMKNRVREATE